MASSSARGLSIRVGTDLRVLADDLAARLACPVGPVLEPELVVVPTPGIGRWLESVLSRTLGAVSGDDGICANFEFQLVGQLLARLDHRGDPRRGGWSVGAMTVAALGILLDADDSLLAALRHTDDEASVFTVARAAADVFDQLFRWRPDVADRWLAGDDEDARAALLRELARRTSVPAPHVALRGAVARLATGDDGGADLPSRVHLFGADTLAGGPLMVDVLDAMSEVRDVCVHLVVPSLARFDTILGTTSPWGPTPPERARGDETADPLLRSWGTASGDASRLLAQLPRRATTSIRHVESPPRTATTLLQGLQRTVVGERADPLPPDPTVALHGCVGPLRQVEVVRDAILHALADDPTLAPSDVVVLCADLPRFAPYVEAVLGDPQGAPRLPYVVRDRAVSRAVPLVAALDAALRVLAGRLPRSAVLDLLRLEPVRRRFGLGVDDVDRITEWAAATDVRWGLDGPQRAAAGLPSTFDPGTWRRALDRLVAGAALPGGAGGASLGLRAVDVGHSLERVGALCDVLDTLAALRDAAATPRPVTAWCGFAQEVAASLFSTSWSDPAGPRELDQLLEVLERDAEGVETAVPFHEFRALLADRAASVRDLVVTGPGGVTVTSFAPLRNVPFRVVALLGLDERSIERGRATDVAFGAARVGDRDARTDLRAALLAAILSARDRLFVTYESRDVVSNEDVAPATVLAELIESLGRTCRDVAGLVRSHPRHGHGDDDLLVGADGPFGFDEGALHRALELRDPFRADDAIRAVLPVDVEVPRGRLDLRDLAQFLRGPQREFLRATLGVRLVPSRAAPDDELPTSLDELERWHAVTALANEGLDALDGTITDEEWSRFAAGWAARPDGPLGVLPGRLSERALTSRDGVSPRARDLRAQVDGARGTGEWERRTVEVDLADGDVLVGEVDVFDGRRTVAWTASAHERNLRVDATLDVLLLTAAEPDVRWRSMRVFRDRSRAKCVTWAVPGEGPAERRARAVAALSALVDLRRRGLAEPVPLLFRATMAMLPKFSDGPPPSAADLLAAGLTAWSPYRGGGDGLDPAVRYCFDASYEELAALPALPGDPAPRFDAGGSRLLTYSLALLDGLCALDDVGTAP
ncbi:MAG TPA: exodeoxyribonuclease V subunit gamma [Acidimicrobiales bacterium]|jgi:exodeoxyribonuclease V gamma subunit|nr:exodeoxyribonuclease V subunit gamma [Acidimicrobiales bacterium]